MDVDVISEVEQAYLDAKSAVETAIANGIENIADLTAAAHVAHETWLAAQATASLFARRNLQAHEDLRSFVIHIVENPDGHTSDEVADAWTGIQHHEDAHRALVIAHGSNLDPPVAHLDPYVSQAMALSDLVSYDTSSGIDVSEDGSTLLFTVGTPDSSADFTSMTFTTTQDLTLDNFLLIAGGGSGSTHTGGGGGAGGLVRSSNLVIPTGTHTISLGHGGRVPSSGYDGIGSAGHLSRLTIDGMDITAYGGNYAGSAVIYDHGQEDGINRGSTGGGDWYFPKPAKPLRTDMSGTTLSAGEADSGVNGSFTFHHHIGGNYGHNSGGGGGGSKTAGGDASLPSYGGNPGHPFRATMPNGDYVYFGAGGGGGYHLGTRYDPGYASIGGSGPGSNATPVPSNSHGSGGGGGGRFPGLGAAGSHGALLMSFSHHGSTAFPPHGVTVV